MTYCRLHVVAMIEDFTYVAHSKHKYGREILHMVYGKSELYCACGNAVLSLLSAIVNKNKKIKKVGQFYVAVLRC